MISRSLWRAAAEAQWQSSALPPTFLLPLRATLSTSPIFIDQRPLPVPSQLPKHSHHPSNVTDAPLQTTPAATWHAVRSQIPPLEPQDKLQTPASTNSDPLPETIRDLLPVLWVQPSHYITVHIHTRPYLLTEGDTLRLPFHMPKVKPGDVLRLNRASSIGSRDYTMRGAPYLDENLFECRVTVVGVEAEPMRYLEKTKRRNRKVKTVKSKHRFTVLKVKELKLKTLEEVEGRRGHKIVPDTIADSSQAG